jgi:hypothetical protein
LKQADEKQMELVRREKGFTLYVNGANAASTHANQLEGGVKTTRTARPKTCRNKFPGFTGSDGDQNFSYWFQLLRENLDLYALLKYLPTFVLLNFGVVQLLCLELNALIFVVLLVLLLFTHGIQCNCLFFSSYFLFQNIYIRLS